MFGEEENIAMDLGQGTSLCYQLITIAHINASDPDTNCPMIFQLIFLGLPT